MQTDSPDNQINKVLKTVVTLIMFLLILSPTLKLSAANQKKYKIVKNRYGKAYGIVYEKTKKDQKVGMYARHAQHNIDVFVSCDENEIVVNPSFLRKTEYDCKGEYIGIHPNLEKYPEPSKDERTSSPGKFPLASSKTLGAIKQRNSITIGIYGNYGFGVTAEPEWIEFQRDVGGALAAAVLGNSSKVKIKQLTSRTIFTALQSGEVDVIFKKASLSMDRNKQNGLNFSILNYIDEGIDILTYNQNIVTENDINLKNKNICVAGGISEADLSQYLSFKNIEYKEISPENDINKIVAKLEKGDCEFVVAHTSILKDLLLKLNNSDNYSIIPNLIPPTPIIAETGSDTIWQEIVDTTIQVLIQAERLEIGKNNIVANLNNPEVKNFIDVTNIRGKYLGLNDDWASTVITQVGNYAELFNNNMGDKTTRGLNALWEKGGLLYAPEMNQSGGIQ